MRIVNPVVPEVDVGDMWLVRRPSHHDQTSESLCEQLSLVDLMRQLQHQTLQLRDIALVTTSPRKASRTATQLLRRMRLSEPVRQQA